MGGTGVGLRGAPLPRCGSASTSSSQEDPPVCARRRGRGGLFYSHSRQPGRQEVSAQPARCEGASRLGQPQLDYSSRLGVGGGAGRVCRGRAGLRSLLCSPPPQLPLPEVPLAHLGSGPLSPSVRQCRVLVGSRTRSGRGPSSSPWDLSQQNQREWEGDSPSAGPACPPLFTRLLPPRKLNPARGNFIWELPGGCHSNPQ